MKLVIPTKLVVFSKKEMPFWELILITYLFCAYLLPSVSLGTTLVLGLLVLYCGYLALQNRYMLKFVSGVLLLIVALAVMYWLLTDASSIIAANVSNRELKRFMSKIYEYLTLYFPAILFVRIEQIATEKQKKFFVGLGLALMVYVIITTWSFLQSNQNATREWENFEEVSRQGVAHYYFIYAVPIIISALSLFLFHDRGVVRAFSAVCILAGIVFLVNAQYTLSILIAVIGVLVQIFRNLRSAYGKVLFILGMIVVTLFLPEILEAAIAGINSDQVSTRLSEIHTFITGNGAGGYNLNSRLTLYGNTIKAFFESPVWGKPTQGMDGHATFLTVLSNTGLLGGVPFYGLLALVCRTVLRELGPYAKQFKGVILMFVMMGLTNPVHASMPIGFATWFLAPLTIKMILEGEHER